MNLNSELRPTRTLLNSNFEGYKLSLDTLPSERIRLTNSVATFSQKDGEFGILAFQLRAQHSCLFVNRWTDTVYWFENTGKENRYQLAKFNCQTNAIATVRPVTISSSTSLPSIHFPSEDSCLISYGDGRIELLTESDEDCRLTIPDIPDNIDAVLVNDVKLTADKLLIAVSYVVQRKDEKRAVTLLVSYEMKNFRIESVDEFRSGSVPSFVALSEDGAILMASDKLISHKIDEILPTVPKKQFKWRQNLGDLVIFLEFEEKVDKSEVRIEFRKNYLGVKVRDKILIGELFQEIDPDESTWTISPGGIEIALTKVIERGWSKVFNDDELCGEELYNEEFVGQVRDKLGHLTSEHPMPEEAQKPSVDSNQYEDCDRDSEFERVIFRFKDGEWTHKASLSANQILFWTQLSGKEKGMVTRNDVDGCVWTPEGNVQKSPMTHVGTFDAFGYVHAGKRDVAYVQCPPNYSYSVIVEHKRRVMFYRKACALNSALRNRTTGKRMESIGRQQLLNLDTDNCFLGVQCTNEFTILLEKENIWKVTVNQENFE